MLEREGDLAALHRAVAVAQSGRLAVVTVSGEAGIGKTRLLQRFSEDLAQYPAKPMVAFGRALAANSMGNGFQPLREAISDILEVESRTARGRLKKIVDRLRFVAPEWLAAVPVVGDVAKAVAVTAGLGSLEPQPTAGSMNAQLTALIRALAADDTFVLIIDDMHWADESTVDAIFFLSQQLTAANLLIVLAFRPSDLQRHTEAHPLRAALLRVERYYPVTNVVLSRLNAVSVYELTTRGLGIKPSSVFIDWLLSRSEGNPLFVHEYLALVRDRLARSDWSLSYVSVDSLVTSIDDIPHRLEVVIDERLEALPAAELRVLQLASIVGPAFKVDEVVALSDTDETQPQHALRCLTQRRGLVRAVSRGLYQFHHGLVQEHTLRRLKQDDVADYQELHYRRGEHILAIFDDSLSQIERLAYHFHEAAEHAKARLYAELAGDYARRLGAVSEAAKYYQWAVEHSDAGAVPAERVYMREKLASVRQEMICTNEAVALLEEATALAHGSVLDGASVGLLVELGRAYRMEERWDDAHHVLDGARRSAGHLDRGVEASLELTSGELFLSGAPRRIDEAERRFQSAGAIAMDPFTLSSVYGHLGFVALAREDVELAAARFARAREEADRSGRTGRIYEAHLWLGKFALAKLDMTQAGEELATMATMAERFGVARTVAHHLRDAGRHAALLGNIDAALPKFLAYLENMLQVATAAWRIRAACYIYYQSLELVEERDATFASALAGQLKDYLASALDSSYDVELILDQLAVTETALRNGWDLEAALRYRGLAGFLDSPIATAARWVFTFHIDDLARFRRRFGYAIPSRGSVNLDMRY